MAVFATQVPVELLPADAKLLVSAGGLEPHARSSTTTGAIDADFQSATIPRGQLRLGVFFRNLSTD